MTELKDRIIEMVDKITTERFIHMIYGFVRRLYQESEVQDEL